MRNRILLGLLPRLFECARESIVVERGFRGSYSVEKLHARCRSSWNNIEPPAAPMRWHLAATGRGIVFRAHRLKQNFAGRHSQHQRQGSIAVIGEKPIVTRF